MCICGDVSSLDPPTCPQVQHGRWTCSSSVWSNGGGEEEEEEELLFCPRAGGMMDSTPALLEDTGTCSSLSGGVSSTDGQLEGGAICTGGGNGVVGRKEVEVVLAAWEAGRREDGGDGLFLSKGKV